MTTLHDIRTKFIKGAAPLVDQYVKAAQGEYNFPSNLDAEARIEVWGTLKSMLLQIKDRQKIDAKNTSEVLKLLSCGKVTVAEATALMKMLGVKSDIDEVPKLVEAIEKLGT